MFYILNILNILILATIFQNDYILMKGSDRLDMSMELNVWFFILLYIILLLLKFSLTSYYKLELSLSGIKNFFISKGASSIFLKGFIGLSFLIDILFFCGLTSIFIKVLFIELHFNLLGRIEIFSLLKFFSFLPENVYIYKIFSVDHKLNYINTIYDNWILGKQEILFTSNLQIDLPETLKNSLLLHDNLYLINKSLLKYLNSSLSNTMFISDWQSYISKLGIKGVLLFSGILITCIGVFSLYGLLPSLPSFFKKRSLIDMEKEQSLYKDQVSESLSKINSLYLKDLNNVKSFVKSISKDHVSLSKDFVSLSKNVQSNNKELGRYCKKLVDINHANHKVIALKTNQGFEVEFQTIKTLKKQLNLTNDQSVLYFIFNKVIKGL